MNTIHWRTLRQAHNGSRAQNAGGHTRPTPKTKRVVDCAQIPHSQPAFEGLVLAIRVIRGSVPAGKGEPRTTRITRIQPTRIRIATACGPVGCDRLMITGGHGCGCERSMPLLTGLWEYGKMVSMKTTVEIPDALFREAKSRAALTGTKLKDLVADGLRMVLADGGGRGAPRRIQFPIIEAKPGEPAITQQMVEEAEEQMLKEEAEHHAKLMRR